LCCYQSATGENSSDCVHLRSVCLFGRDFDTLTILNLIVLIDMRYALSYVVDMSALCSSFRPLSNDNLHHILLGDRSLVVGVTRDFRVGSYIESGLQGM
jgi:hypothetical protein